MVRIDMKNYKNIFIIVVLLSLTVFEIQYYLINEQLPGLKTGNLEENQVTKEKEHVVNVLFRNSSKVKHSWNSQAFHVAESLNSSGVNPNAVLASKETTAEKPKGRISNKNLDSSFERAKDESLNNSESSSLEKRKAVSFMGPGEELLKDVPTINIEDILKIANKTGYTSYRETKGNEMQCTLNSFKNSSQKPDSQQEKPDIFFLETACHSYLLPHQSCSIESTCKHNPESVVALKVLTETLDASDPYLILLKKLPNFHLQFLNPWRRVEGTPLENWFRSGKWQMRLKKAYQYQKPFSASDLSNAFRYLELYLEGGLYMDSDMIALQSFKILKNRSAIGIEIPGKSWNGAFMKFNAKKSKLMLQALRAFEDPNWRGNARGKWGVNGPGLVSKIISDNGCEEFLNRSGYCRKADITILPKEALYTIEYDRTYTLYHPTYVEDTIDRIIKSFVLHLWNSMRNEMTMKFGQLSLLEIVARKNCPLTYEMASKLGVFY